jgi:hypothetical protein
MVKKLTKEDSVNINELKEEFDSFKVKYNLPEFSELNKLFDIEEIDVNTEFLLRRVRRIISERISAYLRFIEIILNPSSAPIFFFKLVRKLDSNDKEMLNKLYESLSEYEIEIISLDLEYSEKKEADFIKKLYKSFNDDTRFKLLEILKKLSNGEAPEKKENNGSYFG